MQCIVRIFHFGVERCNSDKMYPENFIGNNEAIKLLVTSEMIHHRGMSLSKQQTVDLLLCHGTQQDLSLSTVKPNLIAHISS